MVPTINSFHLPVLNNRPERMRNWRINRDLAVMESLSQQHNAEPSYLYVKFQARTRGKLGKLSKCLSRGEICDFVWVHVLE